MVKTAYNLLNSLQELIYSFHIVKNDFLKIDILYKLFIRKKKLFISL